MNQSIKKNYRRIPMLLSAFLFALCVLTAQAQTTAFTYQGRFTDTTVAQPTNGTYQMQFALFDNANAAVGAAITVPSVQVVNGIFSTNLDFGAGSFNGAARLLEIRVFNTAANGYITLAPRQPITSSPYSIRTINANFSDALSTACVGCVDNAKIGSVMGSKVTGTVASATTAATATTAGNVTGVVAIANGGTGSSTQTFVDITNAQNVGGNKTFSNTVSANLFSAGGGGVAMNDNFLRLRGSGDNNHGMRYSSVVDGAEFRGNIGFRWVNGTNGATERMRLDGSGNLTVNGNITAIGTINLSNDSVGTAQVADGSLRLADTAVFSATVGGGGATIPPHACASFTLPNGLTGVVANDIVYFIPPVSSPAGFSFQPVYLTGNGAFSYPFCNTLNTNNTLPAQTYRIIAVRP